MNVQPSTAVWVEEISGQDLCLLPRCLRKEPPSEAFTQIMAAVDSGEARQSQPNPPGA